MNCFYGRKFTVGRRLTKLSQVVAAIRSHRWLMVNYKPQHPNAIRAMSLGRIQGLLNHRGFYTALRNPDAPFVWQIKLGAGLDYVAHSGEWPDDPFHQSRAALIEQIQVIHCKQRRVNRCPRAPLEITFIEEIKA